MTARSRAATLVVAAILAVTAAARAQDPPDQTVQAKVNYVYASQFGFGTYSIGGLSVGVYSLPLQWEFANVLGDADLRLRVPLTYGNYRFSGSGTEMGVAFNVKANTNSLAVEPRLLLDIPIYENLTLTPIIAWGPGFTFASDGEIVVGAIGASQDFDPSEVAFYTYQAGLSSLYRRPLPHEFTLFLGAAFVWAGDHTFDNSSNDDGTTEDYGTFYTGLEMRHPLGFQIEHVTPDAGLFFVYHYFTPDLEFTRAGRSALEVQQIFEIGTSFGSATPMELPYLGDMLDRFRVGLSYQTAPGFNAFRLNFGFPF